MSYNTSLQNTQRTIALFKKLASKIRRRRHQSGHKEQTVVLSLELTVDRSHTMIDGRRCDTEKIPLKKRDDDANAIDLRHSPVKTLCHLIRRPPVGLISDSRQPCISLVGQFSTFSLSAVLRLCEWQLGDDPINPSLCFGYTVIEHRRPVVHSRIRILPQNKTTKLTQL